MALIPFNFGGKCFQNTLLTPRSIFLFTRALSNDCFVDKFSVQLGLVRRSYLPSRGEGVLSFPFILIKPGTFAS